MLPSLSLSSALLLALALASLSCPGSPSGSVLENNAGYRPLTPPAQTSETPTATAPRRVIKAQGWYIPSLAGSTVVVHRAADLRPLAPPIYLTRYRPKAITLLALTDYSEPQAQVLGLTGYQWRINATTQYEVGHRVFSYAVELVPFDNFGVIATVKVLRFYDEDGDGIVETAEATTSERRPAWVVAVGPE